MNLILPQEDKEDDDEEVEAEAAVAVAEVIDVEAQHREDPVKEKGTE